MFVKQIPAYEDNYIYVLVNPSTKEAAVVDPALAEGVLSYLESEKLTLTKIFNTHHHGDHVGGNSELLAKFPQAEVYASTHDKGRIPGQTHFLNHGDTISFSGEKAQIYFVPGHTLGHIAYFFSLQNGENWLFVGDTIFSGGCGRIFEGTYPQMFQSLKLLRDSLPNNTKIYCAHEYTVNNLKKISKLEPHNDKIKQKLSKCLQMREQGLQTVPSTLGEEKEFSSILRWDDKVLKDRTKTETDVETFTAVREFMNQSL